MINSGLLGSQTASQSYPLAVCLIIHKLPQLRTRQITDLLRIIIIFTPQKAVRKPIEINGKPKL
jgi:hypothetical protein